MFSLRQLCYHLCYMLHTPVRLYDAAGECLTQGGYAEDQEDPLICDPAFVRQLLALRRDGRPALFQEHGAVYAVIPAENTQTVILGPFCYQRPTDAASHATALSHKLTHPNTYRISFLPLDYALEATLLLFHTDSREELSREDLALQMMSEEDYTDSVRSDAYSLIYQLRETNSAHNSYAQELREQKAVREGNLEALKMS